MKSKQNSTAHVANAYLQNLRMLITEVNGIQGNAEAMLEA